MNLRYLDSFTLRLRQLCCFMAVLEANTKTFSEAAEDLEIDQPQVSRNIKSLETEIGVLLFDRDRHPPELTTAGKLFAEEIQLALVHLERAITQAQRASRGEIGRLAIGMNSSIANSILPDVLRVFRKRFPDVDLELREVTIDQEIQEILDRRLDVGFEHIPNHYDHDENLVFLPILKEPLVIALPEQHPLAQQPQIPLSALQNEPILLPSLDAVPFYRRIIEFCDQAGFQINAVQNVTATWMITILSLVAAEIGVAILPSNVLNLQRAGVVYRPLQGDNLTRQLAVVWRHDNLSVVLREFIHIVQEVTGH